jgi:hypothetical protein
MGAMKRRRSSSLMAETTRDDYVEDTSVGLSEDYHQYISPQQVVGNGEGEEHHHHHVHLPNADGICVLCGEALHGDFTRLVSDSFLGPGSNKVSGYSAQQLSHLDREIIKQYEPAQKERVINFGVIIKNSLFFSI